MKNQYTKQIHNLEPVFDAFSKILILGSFPSILSRDSKFFYGHPQNRFWKVIATLFHEEVPKNIDEKKALLLKHHIAIWDVVKCCEIIGSADNSIRNVEPNDLNRILRKTSIQNIYVNGKEAFKLYNQYILPIIQKEAILLPSTSPANAKYSLTDLCQAWQKIITIDKE